MNIYKDLVGKHEPKRIRATCLIYVGEKRKAETDLKNGRCGYDLNFSD
jgi:hypothetical protein